MLYDRGSNAEQLMDLEKDPYETRNCGQLPKNKQVLEQYRGAPF